MRALIPAAGREAPVPQIVPPLVLVLEKAVKVQKSASQGQILGVNASGDSRRRIVSRFRSRKTLHLAFQICNFNLDVAGSPPRRHDAGQGGGRQGRRQTGARGGLRDQLPLGELLPRVRYPGAARAGTTSRHVSKS